MSISSVNLANIIAQDAENTIPKVEIGLLPIMVSDNILKIISAIKTNANNLVTAEALFMLL